VLILFQFLSLRYWNRHRGALALSALGVALGIAVFVAIQVANHSVLASFQASLNAVSGKATLQISGGANGLPDEIYVRVRRLNHPKIKAMAPIVSRTFFSPTTKTSLLILGGDLFAESDFRTLDLQAGSTPSESTPDTGTGGVTSLLTDPRAIAVGAELAARHNLRVGSTLELFVGAEREKFRVAAILRGDAVQQTYGGDIAFLDIAAAQEAFDQIGNISRIDLLVDDADIPAVQKMLQPMLPPDALVRRPAQRGAEVSAMLSAFRLNLSALSCIAVFVGAFLIYNAIASAVVRRRREVGILRGMGASRSQLRAMFLLEAACIGLIGSLFGLALGVLLARFALQAVSTTVTALYVAVKAREIIVPVWLLFGAPIGGTLLAVLAAIPPSLEAAATSPRAASNEATLHHTTTRWAWPLAGAGVLLLILAAILSSPQVAAHSSLLGFGAAFCTLGGFALASPLLTLWFARAIQKVCARLFGIEGVLAATQLQRALNRSSLVVAALMVALSMTVGLATMVGSFRQSVESWVTTTITGDLYVATANGFSGDSGPGLPRPVIDFLISNPAVETYDTIRGAQTILNNQPVFIAANELPSLTSGTRIVNFQSTARGEAAARAAHRNGTGILVSERFKNLIGYGSGQTISLQTPAGPKSFFIAGVFYDYTPDAAVIYLPKKLYEKYWNDNGIDAISLYLKPNFSSAQLKRKIENRFGEKYQLTLAQNADIRDEVFQTFDDTFRVTYALQFIAILVAAIGIFETIWSLLLERTRELATLRAIGASHAQIARAILIECALIGVCGWLIGMAAGLALAWQLVFVINRQFFGWTIDWSVPPMVPAQAFVLALLAALGAGVLPAWRVARRRLADALQWE
jgi:putative ABC transport system permease protein